METITEKTYTKLNLKPVKDFIKKEEEKQRYLKRMRKDAKLIVEKGGKTWHWDPFHPSVAQSKVYWNKKELRVFYLAYAALRGKEFIKVEENYNVDDPTHFINTHLLKIAKTVEGFESMSKIKNGEN